MKMSELILAIGDDNVRFQNLDHSARDINYDHKKGTVITFLTEETVNLKGTDRLGLVLWLDRKLVAAAVAEAAKTEGPATAPQPSDGQL
jgi:hypothetical protein